MNSQIRYPVAVFRDLYRDSKLYDVSECSEFVARATSGIRGCRDKGVTVLDIPACFDIETTSYLEILPKKRKNARPRTKKHAWMYLWSFCLNGLVIQGRTWEEWANLEQFLTENLNLGKFLHLRIYVHNLQFEFGFLAKRCKWEKIFAIDTRKPVYAITESGIEFRCSYLLSGYGLESLGKNLKKYPVQKRVGDLDYSQIRHAKTPLSETEKWYGADDTRVVCAYIQEYIERVGHISNIPLTKTGEVREFCRKKVFCNIYGKRDEEKAKKYRDLMRKLTLTAEEYANLQQAFCGGFTHANARYTGRTVENVASYDLTSAYPTVMIAEKFPMGKGVEVEISDESTLERFCRTGCLLFTVTLFGLRPAFWGDNYLSISRCRNVINPVINNGRVVYADRLTVTITNPDWEIIKAAYHCDGYIIGKAWFYKAGYLPTDLVKAILDIYEQKTTLKDVDGREEDYLLSKERLNSIYGMCVTAIIRLQHPFENGEWLPETMPDSAEEISDYNKNKGRFLFYPWGVWVTAWNRRNLWAAILNVGERDYIYSDTDSVKIRNREQHEAFFREYNRRITEQIEAALRYHGIPLEKSRPLTVEGKVKPLGVFDYEGTYTKFRTLGAKRYMIENEKGVNITVSGVNKKKAVPYLLEKYGKDTVFDNFKDGLHIPAGFTGKNEHTYIDYEDAGTVVDYLGNTGTYHEYTSVFLGESPYDLGVSDDYIAFFQQRQNIDWMERIINGKEKWGLLQP